MLRQIQRGLCAQGRVEGLYHIGAQAVALAFQVQQGNGLASTGHGDACAALAAQLQRLAEGDSGGAGVTAGVLDLPGQLRVGDQPGLAPFAIGNADFPSGCGQLRVLSKGGV